MQSIICHRAQVCGCSQFSKSSRILDEKREAVHGKLQVLGEGGGRREKAERGAKERLISLLSEKCVWDRQMGCKYSEARTGAGTRERLVIEVWLWWKQYISWPRWLVLFWKGAISEPWLLHFTSTWSRTANLDLISEIQPWWGSPGGAASTACLAREAWRGTGDGKEERKKAREEGKKEGKGGLLSSLKLLSCLQVVSEGSMWPAVNHIAVKCDCCW